MGWSNASMAGRYQHVPAEVLAGIARQVGGLLWDAGEDSGDDDEGDGTGALVAT
jgi:integrase